MSDRVELVAAVLRRDLEDIELYAQFLQTTLEGALPPGVLEVDRAPSMADKLRGRPGRVERLRVTMGDRRWVLHAHRRTGGLPRGEVVHVVRGMELDHDDLPLDTWAQQLAQALSQYAAQNARTAEALARVTDPRGAFEE